MLTSGRCAIGDAGLMKRARTSPLSGPDCQPLTHAGTRSFLPAELATKTGSCSRPPALQYLPLPPPRSLLVDPLRARARVCARVFLSLPVSASVICLCLCLSLSLSLSQFVSVSVSLSVSSLRSLRLSHSLSPSVRACAARVCVSVFGCAQRAQRSEKRAERREERGERREERGERREGFLSRARAAHLFRSLAPSARVYV